MEQPEYGPEDAAPVIHMELHDPMEPVAALPQHHGLAWENYLRCLFLTGLVFALGCLAWKPGVIRFNMLMWLGNPEQVESLEWYPEAETPVSAPPFELKRLEPPAEWRLAPGLAVVDVNNRSIESVSINQPAALAVSGWRRYSSNPWRWRDDSQQVRDAHRSGQPSLIPAQKPATTFRAGTIAAWPETGASAPAALRSWNETDGNAFDSGFNSAALTLDEPVQTPPPLGEHISTISMPSPVASSLETKPTGREIIADSKTDTDYANREITGPIKDAYLTIYPKLKFIGLCVPGHGYIRKYNQVGVPTDTGSPKLHARDGRTPYGRYYIAERHHDEDGPRLFLSWPSPDDANRINLDPGKRAEVDNAWRNQTLPPQDTDAGGGVGLTGLRNWVEFTEGGFTLEQPDMEEIFTALPDGAWVFIQP